MVRGRGAPLTLVPAGRAMWLMTADSAGQDSPGRIYGLDSATGRVVGSPLAVADTGRNLLAAAGALWLPVAAPRAILRIAPTVPRPAPAPARPEPRPPLLAAGPLGRATYSSKLRGVPFTLTTPAAGWLVGADATQLVEVVRPHELKRSFAITVPDQVFDPKLRLRRAATPVAVARIIERDPDLTVVRRERRDVGGVPATGLTLKVGGGRKAPFCPGPCVPIFGYQGITWFLEPGLPQRIWLLRPHDKLVAIIETAPRGRTLDETGRLLPGLRFG